MKKFSGKCFVYDYEVKRVLVSKVFVHLTRLKLSQISQTYLKIFVWLEHLIKIHLEYYKKHFLGIFDYG